MAFDPFGKKSDKKTIAPDAKNESKKEAPAPDILQSGLNAETAAFGKPPIQANSAPGPNRMPVSAPSGGLSVAEKKTFQVIETYSLDHEGIQFEVDIIEKPEVFAREYYLNLPQLGAGTRALLNNLKNVLLSEIGLGAERMMDPKAVKQIKERFKERAKTALGREFGGLPEGTQNYLISYLLQDMLGLGRIDVLLADNYLEEIVVNHHRDPVWVYHKKYSWLRTNVFMTTEEEIENYATIIARRVGKQITTLAPLLDAHLITGDRANATLFPISSLGNTITIRRFRRDPWTVTDFIKAKTVSAEMMAFVWLGMQYELNIILSGGTGSGKTSFMNVILPFIQPTQRVLTIEDTRELQLPGFLHWVPMTTREANQEGKGGVTMNDLLVNSLRMRPDRIIVGEIRRQRDAEVMFEAMHTGHSVYTTLHANTADETIRRMTNPPIAIPATMLDSVHMNVVMFRNRRLGVRRVLELAEFVPEQRREGEETIKANVLFRWRGVDDKIVPHGTSIRLMDELELHTGLTKSEIDEDLKHKQSILEWFVQHDIHDINEIGVLMAEYYRNPADIEEQAAKNIKPVINIPEEYRIQPGH